ncbi:MAG: copper-binding protein [Acidobacteriota bacterium]|nr:copper-binding protein [Acidobacteriota bacterium]
MSLRPLLLIAFLAVACKQAPQVRRYTLHGKIESVDVAGKTATIHNEKIEGWMEPMTMEYPVPDPAKLHPGDAITATVVVSDLNYHLEDIKSP